MFYKVILQDHVRVPPIYFGNDKPTAVLKAVKQRYEGYLDADLGIVVDVTDVKDVRKGTIISGDGAIYYDTTFEVLVFKPELQEAVYGPIKDITDFGAFLALGPIDGMIHISQTMDDFVSFAKDKVLTGRDTKRGLKVGDLCRARVIAVSFKDITNPKIGLTMRQPGLGKIEWLTEEPKKEEPKPKKEKK
jgi:DNA-directed RNA polymerase subunit E'